ncbi:flagellar hook protein FlgE [Desulfonispora thiosulfatigenes DSM 11270]|uniref:Flagellar hook protein FlgE n=1 Tax=Desulfonispora thiosulfatigenes DSM 11270 TaxID=656914 RepID=A0A1W1UMP9_DESTI|nr:flagellar hook-basal body complex protein [Desulfonispora thiosulfatigenes]SMB82415.1 flagellar hook protein FlgE [Desulfonispora thiosulfatigenes DSM 11270]
MMRSLYSGVSGLRTHQEKMDVVGNNIANVNTIGFKKSNITFQDTLSQTLKDAGKPRGNRGGTDPSQIGLGVMVGAINTVFTQGAPATTGNATDLAIQGEGLFMLKGDDNETYYTRAGAFKFDKEGTLVNSSNGMKVLDSKKNEIKITNMEDVKNVSIAPNGEISFLRGDNIETLTNPVGIAKCVNPAGLLKAGENLYLQSNNSGNVTEGAPGEKGRGTLLPNALEMSNVDIAQEFTDMIITQRGFQANSKTIKTADEILQELVNIKR